jgi:hypothetical protein
VRGAEGRAVRGGVGAMEEWTSLKDTGQARGILCMILHFKIDRLEMR